MSVHTSPVSQKTFIDCLVDMHNFYAYTHKPTRVSIPASSILRV